MIKTSILHSPKILLMTAVIGFFCLSVLFAVPGMAQAASAGDLIKSAASPAVYYLGQENKKYVFPDDKVFFSWYQDFSTVTTVSLPEMISYPIGGNVVVRSGTKLIQFVTFNPGGTMTVDDPKIYAVEPNGVRRWITTAEIATALYGPNWEQRIYPVPSYLVINYPLGSNITLTTFPAGSYVKKQGTTDRYYINASGQKQLLSGNAATENMFKDEYLITTNFNLDGYVTGQEINSVQTELTALVAGTPANQPEHAYYVATNGSDNNIGSLAAPFKTISKAAQTATAGDIIYIRGGTYNETITPPNSGTAGHYITFTKYPGESVIIRGTAGYGFYLNNVDYLKIDHLTITRGLDSGGQIIPAYLPYRGTTPHGFGIDVFRSDHNIITNNDFYDNGGGVQVSEGGPDANNLEPSRYNQIVNNTIHNNGQAGIRVKRADQTIIDSNRIYYNGLKTNNVYSEASAGLTYYCSDTMTITNNTIYGNSASAIDNYAGTNSDTCDASNTLIANNILSQTLSRISTNPLFANKKTVLIIAEKEATDFSHVYKNNIFYNGVPGSDLVVWGANNTGTTGENLTLNEFNAAAHNLNSESGLGNVETATNPR